MPGPIVTVMTSPRSDRSPALSRPYSLTPERYVELIGADAHRLLRAARAAPDAAVAGCPGWTTQDLVDHVAMVYLHKVECMRRGSPPDPWPPTDDADIPAGPFAAFETGLHAVLDELGSRDPDATTFTWFPPDQTVGFWYRRMAHETAVHRLDAERAAGAPTAIDPALAVDGIDEVLGFFDADGPADAPLDVPTGRLAIHAGPGSWLVEVSPAGLRARPEPGSMADDAVTARLTGDGEAVLWWAWRGETDGLSVDGDPALVAGARAHLAANAD